MSERVLIAYATFTGSTAEVAAVIGEELEKRGFVVDVKPMSDTPTLESYDRVLLGSAVQYAKWLPDAMAYLKTHQQELKALPVAVFSVHIQNLKDDAESRRNRHAYLDEVRALIDPAEEAFFAGRFDRRGARLLLPKWLAFFIPRMDFRKWKRIRAWGQDVFAGV